MKIIPSFMMEVICHYFKEFGPNPCDPGEIAHPLVHIIILEHVISQFFWVIPLSNRRIFVEADTVSPHHLNIQSWTLNSCLLNTSPVILLSMGTQLKQVWFAFLECIFWGTKRNIKPELLQKITLPFPFCFLRWG